MQSGYNQLNDWFLNNQNTSTSKLNYRLPTDLLPVHYDVLVNIQFVTLVNNTFPYKGEVNISFRCVRDTSSLVLHVNKLDIDNSSLILESTTDNQFISLRSFNWYNDFTRHFFIANLTGQTFKANQNYTLFMKYVGYLTDDNAGFYRSSYTDDNGVVKWLMTSQLESTSARKSFPCFDEPAMKETFKISAIHQADYRALSNMPIQNRTEL